MAGERKVGRYLAVISAVVLLGAMIFLVNLSEGTVDNSWIIVSAMIVVSIGVLAFISIRRTMKESRNGFPMDDEMSKAIKMKAGYLSFFISMYFLFAMSFVHSMFEDTTFSQIPTSELLMIYVAAMGSIFLVSHAYLTRKGVPG
jgi:hypothetical protein